MAKKCLVWCAVLPAALNNGTARVARCAVGPDGKALPAFGNTTAVNPIAIKVGGKVRNLPAAWHDATVKVWGNAHTVTLFVDGVDKAVGKLTVTHQECCHPMTRQIGVCDEGAASSVGATEIVEVDGTDEQVAAMLEEMGISLE